MSLYCIVWLVTATLLTSTNAASTATDPGMATPDFARHSRTASVPATRMLRVDQTQEDEERALKLFNGAKFVNWLATEKSTITYAERFRVNRWLRKKRTSEYVFHRLHLDGGVKEVLTNPKLQTYAAYIDRFNKGKQAADKVTMLDMFTKTYGDFAVAKMLETKMQAIGKSSPTTDELVWRLRTELLNSWERNGESAEDIFKLLELDKAGNSLFASLQLSTWKSYTRMTYPTRDTYEVMLSILAARYGYGDLLKIFLSSQPSVTSMRFLALKLETAMGKMSPNNFFKLLKLDDGVDNILSSSNMKAWENHLSSFNSRNPDKATTRMETFTEFYTTKELSGMLEAAKGVPRTRGIATELLLELKKQTMRAKRINKTNK